MLITMRPERLQVGFETGGEHGWTVWMWGGDEPLDALLRPGFFDALMAGRLRAGDMILFGQSPRRCYRQGLLVDGPFRLALLMVVNDKPPGTTLRLVQDWGDLAGPVAATSDAGGVMSGAGARAA
jgi:hypothetical protein